MNIVIPMAGLGSRFVEAGYTDPKPFIPVYGKPMIEHVIRNVLPNHLSGRLICLTRQEHIQRTNMVISGYGGIALPVQNTTQGAACTVMLAADYIDNDKPLLVANSDQLVDFDINEFMAVCADMDGGILTFRATHPKWSYVRCDHANIVLEVAEKMPISDIATVGIYYFKHGKDFIAAAKEMIRKNVRYNNEYYLAPTYNELILAGKRVISVEVPTKSVHGLGTPADLEAYLATN